MLLDFEPQVTEFGKLYREMKATAELHKSEFLSFDHVRLKKKDFHAFVPVVYKFYKIFAFFNDDEVIKRFQQLGLSEYNLRWLISMDDLTNEFNCLAEEKGILVN